MILVDTSVWIDHLHGTEPTLVQALETDEVMFHPLVTLELALGSIRDRAGVLSAMAGLRSSTTASPQEVLTLVGSHELWGRGLGVVDLHILAATLLQRDSTLWTRDTRLRAAAVEVGASVVDWT